MRQCDLASATAAVACARGPEHRAVPSGSGLLLTRTAQRQISAFAALLPDFTIARRLRDLQSAGLSGILRWSDARYPRRARGQAASLGVPLLLFGQGLLRAPPGWGNATPLLSATAQATIGPSSPADVLDARRVLLRAGWETPEL